MAYFVDTTQQIIPHLRLSSKDSWPIGDSVTFINLRANIINPYGAVLIDLDVCKIANCTVDLLRDVVKSVFIWII